LAYAGESNIPSKNVVNDDGKEEIEDRGDGEDGVEGSALAEIGASGAAPIVARASVVIALVEIGSSP
jgi:hypothetical protein